MIALARHGVGQTMFSCSFRQGKNGFHGSTCLVWRSAVRAASQMYRDLNHEETRKSELLGGLNPGVPVWALHGGFGSHFTVIWIQLMVFSSHGNFSSWEARNGGPP